VIDFPAMRHTLKLATVLLVGALTIACGSAADNPDTGGTSTAADSFETYQLAFAECMREHGIDMPDPSADGSVKIPAVKDMTAFTEASEACQKKLGQPPAPEGGPTKSDEERLAEMVKTAECFREHGVNVPDPKAGEIISIPMDAPEDVLAACAPNGISGPAAPGGK
jgi:hypothetical protein